MKGNSVAYIDGANLKKGVESLGWRLDYGRFRVWLSDLLKRTGAKIAYVNDQRTHLATDQQKKLPTGTEPRKDLFRGD